MGVGLKLEQIREGSGSRHLMKIKVKTESTIGIGVTIDVLYQNLAECQSCPHNADGQWQPEIQRHMEQIMQTM
jgi:hypothetical protein